LTFGGAEYFNGVAGATILGGYTQVQKTVMGGVRVQGGTATPGTGNLVLTLPVAANDYVLGRVIGRATILTNVVASPPGTIAATRDVVLLSSTTVGFIDTSGGRTTNSSPTSVNSTWSCVLEFQYEAN
jgi:hypothetical protein